MRHKKTSAGLATIEIRTSRYLDNTSYLCLLTSAGVRELGAPQEAQVAGPRPHGLGVAEAQLGAEVVGVQRLLAVHGVVAGGVVRAAHPHLDTQDDTRGAFKDHLGTW